MIIEVNADPVIDRWFVNEWSTIKDNICINKRADVDAAMNGADRDPNTKKVLHLKRYPVRLTDISRPAYRAHVFQPTIATMGY